MFTALDLDPAELDQHDRNFVTQVRQFGWFGTHVFGDEDVPAFSYTTGFWVNHGHPELIVFGLKRELAHDVFWHTWNDLPKGRPVSIGVAVADVLESVSVYFLPVDRAKYADYLGWSRWFYRGDDFECLQLVIPTTSGVFPWHPDASKGFLAAQRDLTAGNWAGRQLQ
ncbi:MAG: DUF4262 domain-containing protein [Rhodobacter sp.]|nr:DUF4262 domain-containing protein [Rhodobacter sp.]